MLKLLGATILGGVSFMGFAMFPGESMVLVFFFIIGSCLLSGFKKKSDQ